MLSINRVFDRSVARSPGIVAQSSWAGKRRTVDNLASPRCAEQKCSRATRSPYQTLVHSPLAGRATRSCGSFAIPSSPTNTTSQALSLSFCLSLNSRLLSVRPGETTQVCKQRRQIKNPNKDRADVMEKMERRRGCCC